MTIKKAIQKINEIAHEKTVWLDEIGSDLSLIKPSRRSKENLEIAINNVLECLQDEMRTIVAHLLFHDLVGKSFYFLIKQPVKNEEAKEKFIQKLRQDTHENFIYVFWGKHKKCLYVGRTTKGINRPANHFLSYWLKDAGKVEIFPILNKKNLNKAECLAIHFFQPEINKTKFASIVGKSPKCPVCNQLRLVKKELSIFLK
jgi:hypothetical protein